MIRVPSDLRKISWLAVTILVLLRISIGWHLFYEGLWKIKTQNTATPWTAEGYLKIATGPLRTTFRNMTGDPNDLKWLDLDTMKAKWEAWRERFETHYQFDDDQKSRLSALLNGTGKDFSVDKVQMPPDFSFEDAVKSAGVAKDAIKYDANGQKLIVSHELHLLPVERARLIEEVKESREKAADKVLYDKLIEAIENVATRSSRLSYYERLSAMLKGDPERGGIKQKVKKDGDDEIVVVISEVDYYRDMIRRYDENHAKAKTKSEWDHLDKQWSDLQAKRRSLVGPIQAMEKDLIEDAYKIVTQDQFALGAPPEAVTEMTRINLQTMWGLAILGTLLMVGFCTRLAALGGAVLLFMFYMALPPWPGLQEPPGIEHNLIVNKVFVEIVALLALVAMPSGRWFGLDALAYALFSRRKSGTSEQK